MLAVIEALLLGIVEGLTEFLPVSSTAHLMLVGDLLGFEGSSGKTFEIVIQLGAILAVCWVFRIRLWDVATTLGQPRSFAFVRNVLLAFLPSAVVGAVAYKYIRQMLDSPLVAAVALVVGGIAILVIERLAKRARIHDIEDMSPALALGVGACQLVSMIPGVSRAGATILGAMLLGLDRRAAAEFSFFLAIPTMCGASAYALYKNWASISFDGIGLIAIGFVAAFFSALVVVRGFIGFVGRHGFTPFAWYRIVFGSVMMAVILLR
ncbi:undecaprenyl pyrophosphate phosphatase [Paramagnetospirillum caucaseum]|uniref:Undecaprenyl-diphosphatase n=1 Tax=Paramagnetospirillum caucaseum TaxID=1244869 RepID=M2Y590_9PROT|nr:undecaprenyl-diphosphate phosphatase [Paramagnetospirillum caucaseum]EME68256.1 undecaprenyl pyrophosphate phosphatase [Paramagnetospirillum caucaseum]